MNNQTRIVVCSERSAKLLQHEIWGEKFKAETMNEVLTDVRFFTVSDGTIHFSAMLIFEPARKANGGD